MRVLAPVLASFLMGACASGNLEETGGVYDPFEPVNRVILDANLVADDYVLRPVAQGYGTVVPEPVRDRIRNVLRNMGEPITFANQMLQGDWEGAEVAVSRFFINSTIGLAGLHDVAAMDKRLEYRDEDFGQTLAVWGVEPGPYLVLPLLGPSNVRDTVGIGVDIAADPIRWATGPIGDIDAFGPSRTGARYIDIRERTIEPIREMRENSLDFYATLRSSYNQFRQGQIREGRLLRDVEIPQYDFPEIPDYEAPESDTGSGEAESSELPDAAPAGDQMSEVPRMRALPDADVETATPPVGTVVVERRSLLQSLLPD